MKLRVHVIPKASKLLVKQERDRLKVYLTRPAQDGLANTQLVSVLADHFKLKKYQVRILQGDTSREKLVEIDL